jgi:hypothetical protein
MWPNSAKSLFEIIATLATSQNWKKVTLVVGLGLGLGSLWSYQV